MGVFVFFASAINVYILPLRVTLVYFLVMTVVALRLPIVAIERAHERLNYCYAFCLGFFVFVAKLSSYRHYRIDCQLLRLLGL